jgi:hypothetical protein
METLNKIKNKILIEKDGMKFTKVDKNKFNLSFSIENKNIHLGSIINFDFIKLIYELNTDIYEKVILQKIDGEEASIILIMKHFFNDLGFPQKYSYMNLKKTIKNDNIYFEGSSNFSEKPAEIPNEVELLPVENLNIECIAVTPHKFNFNFVILFHNSLIIPSFIEKVISMIVNKLFNRVKQFIESIKV